MLYLFCWITGLLTGLLLGRLRRDMERIARLAAGSTMILIVLGLSGCPRAVKPAPELKPLPANFA